MKTSPILIIALAVGAMAAPAFAASSDQGDRLKVTYDAKHDKYCVSQEITGQMTPQRICKTKDQWARMGAVVGQKPAAKLAQGQETTATN